MKISVIIPALNEAKNIVGSLDSIERQQGEFEIIVVDGCSADGTADLARQHAMVINSKERGTLVAKFWSFCMPIRASPRMPYPC